MNKGGSKGTLDLDHVQDNHPLMGTNGMTTNKNDESDRLDYSFIGSQVGYNVNRDIEEQINKIDDLEQVPEEEEVDWWLMLHTLSQCCSIQIGSTLSTLDSRSYPPNCFSSSRPVCSS